MEVQNSPQHTKYPFIICDLLGIILLAGILFSSMMLILPIQKHFEAQDLSLIHKMLTSSFHELTLPLYYWLTLAISKLVSSNYIALRSLSVACALLNLSLLYLTMRIMFTRGIAILACTILATSLLFAGSAVFVGPQQLSFLIFSAILYTTIYICFTEGKKTYVANLYFWFLLGIITLCNGIYLAGLILFVLVVWLCVMKNKTLAMKFHSFFGYLIFLAITGSWIIYASTHMNNFLHLFFIHPLIENFNALKANHYAPHWHNILALLLGFMPWSIFLINAFWYNTPASWQRQQRQSEVVGILLMLQTLFFIIALLVVKLNPIWSILPFSCFAIMCARYLAPGLQLKRMPLQRNAYDVLFILFVIILAYGVTHFMFAYNKTDAYSTLFFEFIIGYIILAAIIVLPLLRYASIKKALVALVLLSVITYVAGTIVIRLDTRSHQLLTLLNPDGGSHFIITTELMHEKNLFSR